MVYAVGITGSIASGKGLVCGRLIEKGYPVMDADELYDGLLRRNTILKNKLLKLFTDSILDRNGEISKKKLSRIVFNNKKKLNQLNRTVHPYIYRNIKNVISGYSGDSRILFLSAPLIIESDSLNLIDYLAVIYIKRERQLKYLMERDIINEEKALKKIMSQGSSFYKLNYADFVIFNDSTKKNLFKQVDKLINKLHNISKINNG